MGKENRRRRKLVRLADDHQWKCTPGYMLVVTEGGGVRFEAPSGWYHDFYSPDPSQPASIRVCDVEPPDDNCRLLLSVVRFPLHDIDSIPLENFEPRLAGPQAHHLRRPGQKVAWTVLDVVPDRSSGRPILTFLLYGLAPGVQAVLSMSVWEEDYASRLPLWRHVVETFDMTHRLTDLRRGTGPRPHLN